jgi:TolA-binding protein
MATTSQTPLADPLADQDRAAALFERLKANRQLALGGLIAVALVVLIAWFMIESGRRKEIAAMAILETAWSLQDQGESAQAATEFQRLIDNFSGTDAALQAALALNQVRLEIGQAQLAVDGLREFLGRNPPSEAAASAHRLLGAALEDTGQPAEAAAAYEQAAALAGADHLTAAALLAAARAWRAAGNTEAATAALRRIVDEFKETAAVSEATVRLAELTKGAMD